MFYYVQQFVRVAVRPMVSVLMESASAELNLKAMTVVSFCEH